MELEDLTYYSESGEHSHRILHDAMATSADGQHMHLWYFENEVVYGDKRIESGTLWTSAYDGAHEHEIAEGWERTSVGGAHRHGVMRKGVTLSTELGGAHDHALGFRHTREDGMHVHNVKLGDMTFPSLLPADLHRMAQAKMAREAEEGEPMTIKAHHDRLLVMKGDELVSSHADLAGAERALEILRIFDAAGLPMAEIGKHYLGLEHLAKATAKLDDKVFSRGSAGSLLSGLGKLVDEDF